MPSSRSNETLSHKRNLSDLRKKTCRIGARKESTYKDLINVSATVLSLKKKTGNPKTITIKGKEKPPTRQKISTWERSRRSLQSFFLFVSSRQAFWHGSRRPFSFPFLYFANFFRTFPHFRVDRMKSRRRKSLLRSVKNLLLRGWKEYRALFSKAVYLQITRLGMKATKLINFPISLYRHPRCLPTSCLTDSDKFH